MGDPRSIKYWIMQLQDVNSQYETSVEWINMFVIKKPINSIKTVMHNNEQSLAAENYIEVD